MYLHQLLLHEPFEVEKKYVNGVSRSESKSKPNLNQIEFNSIPS